MFDPEHLEIGRDWFASAELTDTEKCQILGTDPARQAAKQADFNLIGTFLHHQVGLHEDEISEWFRMGMGEYLDGRRPLDVWQEQDGFEEVYAAAQAWHEQVAEDLDEDTKPQEGITIDPTPAERQNMQQALDIFRGAFTHCGIDLDTEDGGPRDAGVWNQDDQSPFFIHFQRGSGGLQGYKVGMRDGSSVKRLCLLTWQPPGDTRQIVRASIGESVDGAPHDDSEQSDLEPFPKRADAEPFIRKLEECIDAGALVNANVGVKV